MIETIKIGKPVSTLVCVFYLFCFNVTADVYQWKDKDGRLHFGDKPPTENAVKVEIKDKNIPSNERKELQARREKQQILLEIMEQERLERTFILQEKQENQELMKAECDKKEKYKSDAYKAPHLYELDDKGNKHILNESEFEQHMSEIEAFLKKNC